MSRVRVLVDKLKTGSSTRYQAELYDAAKMETMYWGAVGPTVDVAVASLYGVVLEQRKKKRRMRI